MACSASGHLAQHRHRQQRRQGRDEGREQCGPAGTQMADRQAVGEHAQAAAEAALVDGLHRHGLGRQVRQAGQREIDRHDDRHRQHRHGGGRLQRMDLPAAQQEGERAPQDAGGDEAEIAHPDQIAGMGAEPVIGDGEQARGQDRHARQLRPAQPLALERAAECRARTAWWQPAPARRRAPAAPARSRC